MRLIIILSMLLTGLISATAQDWKCFPLNQHTYYESNAIPVSQITLIVHDSVSSNGVQLFEQKISLPGADSCRSAVYNALNWLNPDFILDSLSVSGNQVVYNQLGGPVGFYPDALPGFTWTAAGSVTITCDSLVPETVFGVPDSVKYFHTGGSMASFTIRLSKRFGFLSFIPFYNLGTGSPVMYNIIGVIDSTMQTGFQPPQFADYFPYQAGDIILWENHYSGFMWYPPHTTYDRDSITQVWNYPDSVIYTYVRQHMDSGVVTHVNTVPKKYGMSDYKFLLESAPSNYALSAMQGFGPDDFGIYLSSAYKRVPDTVLMTTGIEREFGFTGSYLDSNCNAYQVIDGMSDEYTFNTILGHVKTKYASSMSSEVWTHTVIGARLNGVVYGDVDFHVGISESDIADFSLFPNPSTGDCFLNQDGFDFRQAGFVDLFGRVVLFKELHEGRNLLNTEFLSPGIYFIRLTGNKTYVLRFVKN